MKPSSQGSALARVMGAVGWPVLLGSVASSFFYLAIFRGPLNLPIMHRYFAGHPISMCETALFFVGLLALSLKLKEVGWQAAAFRRVPLAPTPAEGESPREAVKLAGAIESAPGGWMGSYLFRRLHDALSHVARCGSADGLDEELKYLADQDADRQHESYSLVRIVVWAIPILGFLGTVVGIAQSLGNLDPKQLATSPTEAMQGLLAGLYVAFDTTAIALAMSMALMFLQFPIERVEVELLSRVADRTASLILGRFQQVGHALDPHLASIERMCYAVVRGVENLAERQAQIWQQSLEQTQLRWHEDWKLAGTTLQQAVTTSLQRSLATHADQLGQLHQRLADSAEQRWRDWQVKLDENAQLLREQQQGMLRQSEMLARIVEATGDVMQLERALNENLRSLAGTRNFEDMVLSLSAAIQLLSSRVGVPADARRIDLRQPGVPQERAA